MTFFTNNTRCALLSIPFSQLGEQLTIKSAKEKQTEELGCSQPSGFAVN
jgi:hypothetical protein